LSWKLCQQSFLHASLQNGTVRLSNTLNVSRVRPE
jgi:hypothetical protein